MKAIGQAVGAGIVALLVLFPKTTQADAVGEDERMGEYEEDGQRFGAIVVKGELEASPNAPGGWTLVRTFENKSDDAAEITLDERVMSTESMYGARVTPAPTAVLTRTQKIALKAHEKKRLGTYIPAALGESITKGRKTAAWAQAQMVAGFHDNGITYDTFGVSYLRPLAKGETAKKPSEIGEDGYVEYRPKSPVRIDWPRPKASKAKGEPRRLDLGDEDSP